METLNLEEELNKTERLGSCEVCNTDPAKYTCPKCEIKTCCLKCSKIHKNELECDGLRDRTKYKPLKQMTSMDFMNDYYFLEEATRFTKEIKCNKMVRNQARPNLRFIKLRKEALNRNVKLYFLNNGLAKRKRNQSMFKIQEQTIYWMTELVFPNACNYTICKKFSENTKILDILKNIFDGNEQIDKKLEFYKAEGTSKLRVLLKAEGLKKSGSRFFEVNPKKSLKSCLAGKVIIEYPTLYVAMNHSADAFDVIQSDDEDIETEMKEFKKTLHEEIFSKKVGVNPAFIVNPEEVPIIADVVNDGEPASQATTDSVPSKNSQNSNKILSQSTITSDDEVQPANYFFSSD